MKEISIIIPTYKPKEYIYECLKSIEKQSLKEEKFEVIIVLNGEKEPFFSELQKYVKKYKNYRLLYSKQTGVSNARNIGIENSECDYIMFLDDDDYLTENYLTNMLKLAQPEKIIVSNLLCFKDNENRIITKDYVSKEFDKFNLKNNNDKELYDLFKMRKFFSNACGKLIYKQNIDNTLFDSTFSKGEDAIFMSEISRNIKSVVLSDVETVYYRRIRMNSASRSREKIEDVLKKRCTLIMKYLQIMIIQRKNYLFHLSRIVAQVIGGYKEVLK